MRLNKDEMHEAWKVVLRAKNAHLKWAYEKYKTNPAAFFNIHHKRINVWLKEMHERYGEGE